MEVEDRLEVKIVSGRNLQEVEGGECNPFAMVRVGTETEQTMVMNHTTDPEWNAARMVYSNIAENETDHVIITIMHKDLSAQQDQCLGQAIIGLRTSVLSPGIETDEWYDLEQAPGMTMAASGQVRLEMTYFLNEGEGALPEDDADDDLISADEALVPNMLVGTLVRARGLYLEGRESVDSYASLRVEGSKVSTNVLKKDNSPHWGHEFRVPVSRGESSVLLKVKDRGVLRSRLIGTCTIPMVEIAAQGDTGLMKWCTLIGEDGRIDSKNRGDLEIQLAWIYDRKYAKKTRAAATSSSSAGTVNRKEQQAKEKDTAGEAENDNEWLVEEEPFVPPNLTPKEQEELDEQREARVMMADRQLDDLKREKEHQMEPGDYQIQVHVLEARDLKGEDANGLSDPYARVKILNRTKKTRIVRKVTSCIFDETLYFNLKGVTRKEIEEAVVDVQIFDFDAFSAHDLIGLATFDVRAVHSLPDHEYYRKWIGLIDTKSAQDNGYQGFVKLSITVLGPGDVQKAHDVDKEYQEETAAELDAEEPSALGGLSLSGPSLDSKLVFLVVYVWEAEDLPRMDAAGLFSAGGIEAYVKADFAGNSVMTSAVSVRGKGNLAPEYREELWLPIVEPIQSKRITVGLWDYNTFSRDRPVAHLFFDYDEVKRSGEKEQTSFLTTLISGKKYTGPRPRWHNLYGAPLGVQGKRGGLQNVFGGADASTYRGRVLLSMEILTKPPAREKQVAHRNAFHFKPVAGLKPASVAYHFRALAITGSEIPTFRSPGLLGTAKMQLIVSIGNFSMEFAFEPNKRGVVEWNELKQLKNIELPVLIEEMPDVCVYLVRGPPKVQTVCYARIPAAKLLKEQFKGDPMWVVLKSDKARTKSMGGVALTANPGAVLIKFGLGLSEDAVDPSFSQWDDEALKHKTEDLLPYALRVFVFQARNLPASDENGMLDPYVKVRFQGKKEKTKVHSMTTAPLFYQTLQFDEMLPRDVAFGPDIVVQVWDRDTLGSNTPIALLRYPLSKCQLLAGEASRHPIPEWLPLTDINGEPIGTREDSPALLMSAALIRKREAGEKLDRPESITPQMRQAWVEILAVGVRQLKTYRLHTPQEPYVRVDVPAPNDGGDFCQTRPSRKPTGRDANFIERKILAVEMPENALYAQRMDIRVYDSRVGVTTGLQSPLLGATTVNLSKKMSWNADGYEPPQNELFDDTAARKKLEEEEEAKRRANASLAGQDAFGEDDEDFGDDDLFDVGADENKVGGISFGDDDDDERMKLDDEYRDASEREQFELERRDKGPVGFAGEDAGIGAFDPMVVSDLPPIYEDVLYQREQERLAEEMLREEEDKKASGRSFLDVVEARLNDATDVGGMTGLTQDTFKLSDLDISFPSQWAAADYVEGREWWADENGAEFENFLRTKPFESYAVFRGKSHRNPSKSTRRQVGIFKAIIRILDQDPMTVPETIPLKLLRETRYTVRLYVVRGQNLQPVDGNSCDPYLRVKLGKEIEERKREHLTRTLKPDFYETFEFHTTLPGPSTLKIQVKDWNRFNPINELVGETKIDLEDRWFHPLWQRIDGDPQKALDDDLRRPDNYNKLKPIEIRSLKKDTSSVAQGQIHMWLEIRHDSEARRDPPVLLEGPEKRKFEVRIVCWKSMEVPQEMGDYYCDFWIGDSRRQKTDIHWRCRNGKASWNWRIKIPVELPLDSPEKGRLTVQLWDQDIIKYNDVIGDAQIDLYRWFLKAYHEKRSVNIFKVINEAKERKKADELGLATSDDLDDDDDEDWDDDDDDDAEYKDEQEQLEEDIETGDGGVTNPLLDQDGQGGDDLGEGPIAPIDIEAPEEEEEEDDEKEDDKKPLLDKKKKKKKKKDDDEKSEIEDTDEKDAQFFVKQLKELVGLGDLDDSASWINLTYIDRKRNRVLNRGRVALTIEILPEEDAEVRPAGHGRSEPNSNPYLPPTTGRMSFSYNPFYLCSALLGPKTAVQIVCCFCCIVALVALGFLGIYFSSFYTLLESLGLAGPGSESDDDGDDLL